MREVVKRGKNKLGLGPAGSSEVDLATLVSINKRSASGDHGKEESTSSEKGSGSGRKVSDGKGSVGRASKWWKRGGDTTARGNSYVPPPAGATFAPTVDGGVPPDPPQPDCLGLKLVSLGFGLGEVWVLMCCGGIGSKSRDERFERKARRRERGVGVR